jgi:uncharacterized protein DUF4129
VNTHLVDTRTTWLVLAMEAALYLPIMSLPAQGDRFKGLSGPLLLLILLPLGYAAVYRISMLRDPSWRLITGIALALLTRLVVSEVPEAGASGLMVWLGRSVVPAAIGIALWWRGGALAVAELTPAEVRTEFSVLAVCLVAALALVRPFLLPDSLLLGASVGLFAVAGLVGTVLSRQDAADVSDRRLSGALAALAGLVPAFLAVLLVEALRPELMGQLWLLVARAIELALTPIGWFFAWLASLFPQGTPLPQPVPPPVPTPPPIDPAALADAQGRLAWIGTVIAVTLLAAAAFAALLAAKLLLSNFIRDPHRVAAGRTNADLVVERSGALQEEAADVLGWLVRWLRSRLARRSPGRAGRSPANVVSADSWAAYQRLLGWAEARGLSRRPADTTGQFASRLAQSLPEAADTVDLVTETFEIERYGAVSPPPDRLRRVRQALAALLNE